MTWARRDLISATIIERTAHEGSSSVNDAEWPRGSRLSLRYAGGDGPLRLPLRDDERTRRRFRRLVPSLLADLAR